MAAIRKIKRTRYYDSSGRRCNPKTPGAIKKLETSSLYYAHNLIPYSRRPIPLARTLAASKRKLAQIRAGMAEQAGAARLPRPLAQRLAEWRQTLSLSGITVAQQKNLLQKVTRVLTAANALHATELPAEAVRSVFSRWEATKARWAPQTRVHTLKAVNQFLRHSGLPAIRIKLPVPKHHKVLIRGALTLAQATQLLQGTHASARVFRGLSGPRRELLYRLVLTTGLRRGELMRLSGRHLRGLKIVLEPLETKNRQGAVLDLGPELALELAQIRGTWFPGTWHDRSATMVRADLQESGVVTSQRIDLHALRHTYVTWCAGRWGVEVTQRLARHSTSVLTLDYYTHVTPEYAQAAAVEMEKRLARGCAVGVPDFERLKTTDPKGGSNSPENVGQKAHLIGFEPITYGSEDLPNGAHFPKNF